MPEESKIFSILSHERKAPALEFQYRRFPAFYRPVVIAMID